MIEEEKEEIKKAINDLFYINYNDSKNILNIMDEGLLLNFVDLIKANKVLIEKNEKLKKIGNFY